MTTRFRVGMSAKDVLSRLLGAAPERTFLAPKDQRGIYGLVDHHGTLRYVGSTVSTSQTFYERIHQRHRTGSEDSSHYFSRMYNTGRMWRQRNDPVTRADGDLAKALRNAFIAEYCRAVWVPLPDQADIAGLERAVIELAPADAVAWNRRASEVYAEPQDLVDGIIVQLGFGAAERAALARQKLRFEVASISTVPTASRRSAPDRAMPPFPAGPFRFFALDVETANHDRGSICQIGVACVRPDDTIVPWVTYVDPQVDRWAFTYLHKIGPATVRGAPTFREVLPVLAEALRGRVVYQHSGFDRSAIAAACLAAGRPAPEWDWQDSVQVARRAWPELRGNGGHGLASLKAHLNLSFEHHDAGEDARAAALVVLHAEAGRRIVFASGHSDSACDVLENCAEAAWLSKPDEFPPKAWQDDDVPEDSVVVKGELLSPVFVPVARDGTFFHPGLARNGGYQIGPKEGEQKVKTFEEALALLRRMDVARWRRPNPNGNWGIVTAIEWRRMEV